MDPRPEITPEGVPLADEERAANAAYDQLVGRKVSEEKLAQWETVFKTATVSDQVERWAVSEHGPGMEKFVHSVDEFLGWLEKDATLLPVIKGYRLYVHSQDTEANMITKGTVRISASNLIKFSAEEMADSVASGIYQQEGIPQTKQTESPSAPEAKQETAIPEKTDTAPTPEPTVEAATPPAEPKPEAKPEKQPETPSIRAEYWEARFEYWRTILGEFEMTNKASAWVLGPEGPGGEIFLETVENLISILSGDPATALFKKYPMSINESALTFVSPDKIFLSARDLMAKGPEATAAILVSGVKEQEKVAAAVAARKAGNGPSAKNRETASEPTQPESAPEGARENAELIQQRLNNTYSQFRIVLPADIPAEETGNLAVLRRLENEVYPAALPLAKPGSFIELEFASADGSFASTPESRQGGWIGMHRFNSNTEILFLIRDYILDHPEYAANDTSKAARPEKDTPPNAETVPGQAPVGRLVQPATQPKSPEAPPIITDAQVNPEQREIPLTLEAARNEYAKAYRDYLRQNSGRETLYGLDGNNVSLETARANYDAALKTAAQAMYAEEFREALTNSSVMRPELAKTKTSEKVFEEYVVAEEKRLSALKASEALPPREQGLAKKDMAFLCPPAEMEKSGDIRDTRNRRCSRDRRRERIWNRILCRTKDRIADYIHGHGYRRLTRRRNISRNEKKSRKNAL